MPSHTPARRKLLPLALVVAGACALVALFGVLGADGGWFSSWWRTPANDAPGSDLVAHAPTAPAPAAGPTLQAADGAKSRETHGPVTVTVVDLQGVPVGNVRVVAVVAEPPKEHGSHEDQMLEAFADASGRARFDDLPYDGRAVVHATAKVDPNAASTSAFARGARWLPASPPTTFGVVEDESPFVWEAPANAEAQTESERAPSESDVGLDCISFTPRRESACRVLAEAPTLRPEIMLRIDRGLPFRLDVREGGDGRLRSDARWQVRPRLVWADDAYGATTLPVQRGKPATVTCRVEAPRGFVARKEAEWTTTIHPLAQHLEAVYPLRPAIDVILVVPREGMPYRAEDWEGSVTVAGIALENPELRVDAQGRLHVRGGGHIVGDKVEVSGTLAQRFQATGEGFIGADPRDAVVVPLALIALAPTPDGLEDPLVAGAFDWSEVRVVGGEGLRLNVVGCSPPELGEFSSL